jgi:hypothetical protein
MDGAVMVGDPADREVDSESAPTHRFRFWLIYLVIVVIAAGVVTGGVLATKQTPHSAGVRTDSQSPSPENKATSNDNSSVSSWWFGIGQSDVQLIQSDLALISQDRAINDLTDLDSHCDALGVDVTKFHSDLHPPSGAIERAWENILASLELGSEACMSGVEMANPSDAQAAADELAKAAYSTAAFSARISALLDVAPPTTTTSTPCPTGSPVAGPLSTSGGTMTVSVTNDASASVVVTVDVPESVGGIGTSQTLGQNGSASGITLAPGESGTVSGIASPNDLPTGPVSVSWYWADYLYGSCPAGSS